MYIHVLFCLCCLSSDQGYHCDHASRVGSNPSHWLTQAQWGGARVWGVGIAEPSSQHTARPEVSELFDSSQDYLRHWSGVINLYQAVLAIAALPL